jgi:hypothetical protein
MKNILRNQYLTAKDILTHAEKAHESLNRLLTSKIEDKELNKFWANKINEKVKMLLPVLGAPLSDSGLMFIPDEMYSFKRVKEAFMSYEKQLIDMDVISPSDFLTDEQKSAYYGYDGMPIG